MTAAPERPEGTVDPKLLEILVCPMTKGALEYGIPIMLPEEARKID